MGEGMYVGGLIGYKCGYGRVTIMSSGNIGDIRGRMSNVGGLVGLGNDLIVIKSKNSGNIYSLYSVGGLIGGGERSVLISESCNLGNVNGSKNNIGGLVGYIWDNEKFVSSDVTSVTIDRVKIKVLGKMRKRLFFGIGKGRGIFQYGDAAIKISNSTIEGIVEEMGKYEEASDIRSRHSIVEWIKCCEDIDIDCSEKQWV